MSTENFCTYRSKECKRIINGPYGEKPTWEYIKALSGKQDPKHPDQKIGSINPGGIPATYRLRNTTPTEIAENQSTIFVIFHTCIACKRSVIKLLNSWKEIENYT